MLESYEYRVAASACACGDRGRGKYHGCCCRLTHGATSVVAHTQSTRGSGRNTVGRTNHSKLGTDRSREAAVGKVAPHTSERRRRHRRGHGRTSSPAGRIRMVGAGAAYGDIATNLEGRKSRCGARCQAGRQPRTCPEEGRGRHCVLPVVVPQSGHVRTRASRV